MDGADSPKPLLVTVGLFLAFILCLVIMFTLKLRPKESSVQGKKQPAIEQKSTKGADNGKN